MTGWSAVRPAHTPSDSDTLFALATVARSGQTSLLRMGDVTAEAIVRAVLAATGTSGYPAVRDLQGGVR